MPAVFQPSLLRGAALAVREAGTKINTAVRELTRREDEAASWMQRFIHKEIESRTRTRGAAYWDATFPGLTATQRAQKRIDRMLVRGTVAGVAAAAGASAAEIMSMLTEGAATLVAAPLGIVSVGAEMIYTTALQIDLAFDLAAIYGVPFAHDDVGEISTLLGLALGVDLIQEPTRHDKLQNGSGHDGTKETKPWRVVRQMSREDFAQRIGRELIQQSVLRHIVPVVSVLLSAAWNQVILRRYAQHVHSIVKQRVAIVHACRAVKLGNASSARTILDGAWLLASVDGSIEHQEALALSTLIDSLSLPQQIGVKEASFPDDEEPWFEHIAELEPAAHRVLLNVLANVAISDGELSVPERRFLRRLGKVLNTEIDFAALNVLAQRFAEGDVETETPSALWAPSHAHA